MRTKINLIIDLQFGSTGKGLIAGFMAHHTEPDTLVTAWAPNAGHTYIDGTGRKYVHRMVANGIVSPALRYLMIGPGSVIDPQILKDEIRANHDHLKDVSIYVHQNAAVVLPEHLEREADSMTSIASTKKGVGAALISRIERNPFRMNTAGALLRRDFDVVDSAQWLNILDGAELVQIEGAQGYSLSMYHGMYPYTTSRDVSVHQVLADCGIPYGWGDVRVTGTCRTYPIRVGNRYDANGEMVGWSGPHWPDQVEIPWSEIGVAPELTTVTKLPRRIFTFSAMEIAQATMMNGVDDVFLNFANYCKTPVDVDSMVRLINNVSPLTTRVKYVGYGPSFNDVRMV